VGRNSDMCGGEAQESICMNEIGGSDICNSDRCLTTVTISTSMVFYLIWIYGK
jgi:hypothetical protein